MGDMHQLIKWHVKDKLISPMAVFKDHIRTITIKQLLQQYAIVSIKSTLSPEELDDSFHVDEMIVHVPVRLMKIDVEGLDQVIVNDIIDYYMLYRPLQPWKSIETATGESVVHETITSDWPCVIYFETNSLSGFLSNSLIRRLQKIGTCC